MANFEAPPVIVESIIIKAPIAAVFEALTDPEQLPQWWGTKDGYQVTKLENDLRPGGEWKSSGISKDGSSFSVFGVYRVVEVATALEFTWNYSWGTGGETVVRYDLSERNGETEVRVTHSGHVERADRDDHATGWTIVLSWLAAYLTR